MTSWAWKAALELGVEDYCKRSGSPWMDEEPRDWFKVTASRTASVGERLQVGVRRACGEGVGTGQLRLGVRSGKVV